MEEETASEAELQKDLKQAEEEHKARLETIRKQHALHTAEAARKKEAAAEKTEEVQSSLRQTNPQYGTSHRQSKRNGRNNHHTNDDNTHTYHDTNTHPTTATWLFCHCSTSRQRKYVQAVDGEPVVLRDNIRAGKCHRSSLHQ